MDHYDVNEITAGYRERMRRLALFDPLYELERKKVQDDSGRDIDMKGLGLLALLFFFEQKLMRNQRTGKKELAAFLQIVSNEQYDIHGATYDKLAETIIETFRPTHGKKRAYSYFDWETQAAEHIEYSILKAKGFDTTTNAQYYTLDDDGLELVFATKEFYSEFQLSINQLMLRKQLEKGEFRGALRQINEMRIDVESLYERMIKLRHEIQRNIVSEETFERYKQLLEDIHARLARENEEFDELRQFVVDTKNRLYEKDVHRKESKAYGYVLEIAKELEHVHYDHSHLLEQSIELKNDTLKAAQESLYYTGIDSFNFDQDINARLIGSPLPLNAMKGVLHPFFTVHEALRWSPLTMFAEQNIREEKEQADNDTFMSFGEDASDKNYQDALQHNFAYVMAVALVAYDAGCHTLASITDYIKQHEDVRLLEERFFYDFWLVLHQRSPIIPDAYYASDEKQSHALDKALTLLGRRTVRLIERKDILAVTERFSVQNMDVIIEGDELDALS